MNRKNVWWLLFMAVCCNLQAQETFNLNVHFDNPTDTVEIGTRMDYKAYVVNNSGKQVIIYDPMHRDVNRAWGIYHSDFVLYHKNDSIGSLGSFGQGADRKFRRDAEVKVAPGDSLLILAGNISPWKVGDFKFVFKHRQLKEEFQDHVVEKIGKDMANVASFNLVSDTICFHSTVTIVKETKQYTYEELVRLPTDALAPLPAIRNNKPSHVRKLQFKLKDLTADNLDLMPYLKNVRWIDMELKNGDPIPVQVGQLDNLVYLKIRVVREGNEAPVPLSNLDLIQKFTNLEYLSLNNTRYEGYPAWLGKFTHLRYLTLSRGCTRYDLALNKLDKLEEVHLMGDPGVTLPEGIFNLKHLKTLDVSYFETPFPEKLFGQADSLQVLLISKYKGTKTFNLAGCKAETLKLTGYDLPEYPAGLESMANLTLLEIDGSIGDAAFPDLSKTKLAKLEMNNQATKLPEAIGKVKTLNFLALWTPKLATIDAIGGCAELEKLYIYKSSLKDNVSENLLNCKKLRYLAIKGSGLTKFGAVARMDFLWKIDLEENSITTIPAEITNFSELKELWLVNNKITGFPATLLSMPKMEQINLRENPVSESVKAAYTKNIATWPELKKLLLISL